MVTETKDWTERSLSPKLIWTHQLILHAQHFTWTSLPLCLLHLCPICDYQHSAVCVPTDDRWMSVEMCHHCPNFPGPHVHVAAGHSCLQPSTLKTSIVMYCGIRPSTQYHWASDDQRSHVYKSGKCFDVRTAEMLIIYSSERDYGISYDSEWHAAQSESA